MLNLDLQDYSGLSLFDPLTPKMIRMLADSPYWVEACIEPAEIVFVVRYVCTLRPTRMLQ
jgi:hypothetical protein